MAKLVDALDLGSSGATRESSSLSFRTNSKTPNTDKVFGVLHLLVSRFNFDSRSEEATRKRSSLSFRTHFKAWNIVKVFGALHY